MAVMVGLMTTSWAEHALCWWSGTRLLRRRPSSQPRSGGPALLRSGGMARTLRTGSDRTRRLGEAPGEIAQMVAQLRRGHHGEVGAGRAQRGRRPAEVLGVDVHAATTRAVLLDRRPAADPPAHLPRGRRDHGLDGVPGGQV